MWIKRNWHVRTITQMFQQKYWIRISYICKLNEINYNKFNEANLVLKAFYDLLQIILLPAWVSS